MSHILLALPNRAGKPSMLTCGRSMEAIAVGAAATALASIPTFYMRVRLSWRLCRLASEKGYKALIAF